MSAMFRRMRRRGERQRHHAREPVRHPNPIYLRLLIRRPQQPIDNAAVALNRNRLVMVWSAIIKFSEAAISKEI